MTILSIEKGQFSPEKLIFLRELSGLTLREVASKIEITPAYLSLLEHGKNNPSFKTLNYLSELFHVNHTFFLNQAKLPEKTGATFYRKQVAVPKKVWIQTERRNMLFSMFEKNLTELLHLSYFEYPRFTRKAKEFELISFDDIDFIVSQIRSNFDLGIGPISNMTLLVEKMGIRVTFADFYSEKIDALTSKIDGHFYISLNSRRTSSVRLRFNLAHELGHIFLHSFYSEKILQNKSHYKRIESEANYFAGVLLMPTKGLAMDLAYTNMGYLKELKVHWKVSLQALIYRGNQIGIITDQQAMFLRQTVAREGWRKKEPLDDSIEVEKPTFLASAVRYSGANEKDLIKIISQNSGFSENRVFEKLFGTNKSQNSRELHIIR